MRKLALIALLSLSACQHPFELAANEEIALKDENKIIAKSSAGALKKSQFLVDAKALIGPKTDIDISIETIEKLRHLVGGNKE